MFYNDNESILEKFDNSRTNMLIHYLCFAKELPSEMIDDLGININTRKYIFCRGRYSKFTCFRRQKKMLGYQISYTGASDFLYSDDKYESVRDRLSSVIKPETNINKRIRYRRAAYLYLFCDRMNIEYMHSSLPYNPSLIYSDLLFDSQTLKEEREGQQQYSVRGSKIYGCISLYDNISLQSTAYSVYIIKTVSESIDYSTELRMNSLLNIVFKTDTMRPLFMTQDINSINKLLVELYRIKYENNNKSQRQKSSYLIKHNPKYLTLISMDMTGYKQMYCLKNKNLCDAAIINSLSRIDQDPNGLSYYEERDHAFSDARLYGEPCFFLYDLDIIKLHRVRMLTVIRESNINIICFEAHIKALETILNSVIDNISFITMEELNILARIESNPAERF